MLDHGEKIAEGRRPRCARNPTRDRGLSRAARRPDGAARSREPRRALRTDQRARRRLAARRRGRDRHAHRRQRRGQDDDAARDQRPHPPEQRNGSRSTAATSRARRPMQIVRAGLGHVARRPARLRAHDGAREPRAGRVHAHDASEDRRRSASASSQIFPRLRRALRAEGRHAVRRRAADARHRPAP